MSTKTSTASSGGTSFCSLLTVLFIGLKLTGHIDWSWWWVLSPIWLPAAIILPLLAIICIPALIVRSKR